MFLACSKLFNDHNNTMTDLVIKSNVLVVHNMDNNDICDAIRGGPMLPFGVDIVATARSQACLDL